MNPNVFYVKLNSQMMIERHEQMYNGRKCDIISKGNRIFHTSFVIHT
jgi:hypothetical protein